MGYSYKILLFVDILSVTFLCINSAPLTDGNGTNVGDLNGEKLMELGKALQLPSIQIIGGTIDNIEKEIEEKICDLHPCTQWTEWIGCLARKDQISSKSRTRQCRMNMTTCETDSNSRIQKENEICIGYCPNGYNLTENGFCMKFDADNKVTKDAAEQQCQKDGGHLVNIDSEVKLKDVINLLTGFTIDRGIWIDGHRKDVNSPWEYTYGSQKGLFKWKSGEPHNTFNELCLLVALFRNGLKWLDYKCTDTWYAICEISKTM